MHREPQPVKAYTIAPMYRYGAPGRGRYREHYQLSVEAIGSEDPAIDAEIIQLYHELLRRLGVTKWELRLNSIGDANCRPQYVERLNAWLDEHAGALDDDARHKRETSPLQVFDVKTPSVRAALEGAPKIGESLCDDCRAHFDAVRSRLDLYGVPYVLDPTLVRGLDYYSRTTFEFLGPDENANSTICGGGRYDGLVEQIGGPPTPGIGFGAGVERLLLALENEGITAKQPGVEVFFVVDDPAARDAALQALAELRRAALELGFALTPVGRVVAGEVVVGMRRRGARTVVIVRAGGVTIERDGRDEQVVALGEVVATLTA